MIPPRTPLIYFESRRSDNYNDETYDSFGGGPIGLREALNTEKCEMSVLGRSWVTTQPRPQHVMSTSCLQHTTDVAAAGLGSNSLHILLNDRETREFSVECLCRHHTLFLNSFAQHTLTPVPEQLGVSISNGYASPQIIWFSFAYLSSSSCCKAKGLHILPQA